MLASTTEGQPVALSLAEKAVCKVVYGAPRPRPLLLPVGLELWLYVQKMRNLQRRRCGTRRGGTWGDGGARPARGWALGWRSRCSWTILGSGELLVLVPLQVACPHGQGPS